ncbi:MAG: SRPBCC family protein [Prolixibacteraceae bacterium]
MKRFLQVIMWLLFFFALFITSAYFLPRLVQIERSALIEAPPKVVFAQVNDLHSWEKWLNWSQIDPEMEVKYINHGVGEGSGYIWESQDPNIGVGKILITESVPYDSIVTLINFADERDGISIFYFEGTDNTTRITWKFKYDVGYNPVARWMGLINGNYAGPDFEESFENLNIVCKVQVQENSLTKELVILEEFNYASVRKEVSFTEVGLVMDEMFGIVSNFIESANTGVAGMPFSIYHEMEGEKIDLECGIPISQLVEGTESVITGTYPETKCAAVDYYGDYRQLEDAHTALQAWIEEHRFQLAGSPIEFYLTDPATEPDPAKWHTQIYYPVR